MTPHFLLFSFFSIKDEFTVEIATDKNFTQNVLTFIVGSNVTEFTFFPLVPNTKYYMQVAAFNAARPSAWTTYISDKTLR